MPEGATLLLSTDGLLERRGSSLDEGRRAAAHLLAACAGPSLDALCDRLLPGMLGVGAENDVAVLAVRAHPTEGERPAEPGPRCCPAARPPAQVRVAAARAAPAIAATPWSALRIE